MPEFRTCRDCSRPFGFDPGAHAAAGLAPPVRCASCRAIRRRARVTLHGRVIFAGGRSAIIESAGGVEFFLPGALPSSLHVGDPCKFSAVACEVVPIGKRPTAWSPVPDASGLEPEGLRCLIQAPE